MATYNGQNFIQEQVDSFFAQSVLPDLIVASDDCSQDHTVELLEEAQRKRTIKIEVHRNSSTLGFMKNFLKAAYLCDTDLVAFSDQDDIWLPDKIEKCIPYFNDESVQLVVHGSHITDSVGKIEGHQFPTKRLQYIDRLSKDPWYVPLGHTMIFRRSLLSVVGLHDVPPEMVCHERWVFLLASVFGKIVLLPEALVKYRRHQNNVTASLADHSVATRLTRKVAADSMDSQADLFRTYSVLLDNLQTAHDNKRLKQLRTGSAYYNRVTKDLERRRELYRTLSLRRKISVLLGLLSQGGYRSRDKGGLGVRSLARDVVSAWR